MAALCGQSQSNFLKFSRLGEEGTVEGHITWNRSEPSPNAIKHNRVIHTTGQVLIFFPYFELVCTIVIFPRTSRGFKHRGLTVNV